MGKTKDKSEMMSVRVGVVAALMAVFVGVLAIIHGPDKIAGFFVVIDNLAGKIYNFLVSVLMVEVFLGTVFLCSTGIILGFDDYGHSVSRWLQGKSYNWMVNIFPFSIIAVVYNMIATKVFGIDEMGSVAVAVIIVAIIIAITSIMVFIKRKKGIV